ncbi:LuxR C-terminal-related transcriptional regulator [Ferrithrix thermotolerans]|uniref:response regulator transcription factor n=1 Tax=Ferrithrix thermotolerans TaxID=209649 RepID=UPI00093326A8
MRGATHLERYIEVKRHGEGTLARADFNEGHADTFSQTICDFENIGYVERSCLLTKRELQVLVLMSQELSYSEITQRLQISVGTARAHGAAILRKTSSHSRKDAVEKARSIGLLGL